MLKAENGKPSVQFLSLQHFPRLHENMFKEQNSYTRSPRCYGGTTSVPTLAPSPSLAPILRLGASQSMVSDVIARAELLPRPRLAICSRRRAAADVFEWNLSLHARVPLVWLGFNMQEGPCIHLWFIYFCV